MANDHILDTSLGYFGTPLINVLLGYVFLKERLSTLQVVAVSVAAAGTVYLAWYLGRPPWIAMTLALSFGAYGLLRKRLPVGPMLGLLWETALMFLPALAYLVLVVIAIGTTVSEHIHSYRPVADRFRDCHGGAADLV